MLPAGVVHAAPGLYAQLSNFEFCAETITLMGGLFILLSQVRYEAKDWRPCDTPAAGGNRVEPREDGRAVARGRPADRPAAAAVLCVYRVCQVVASNLSDLTHASKRTYFMYVVDVGVVGVLVAAIGLIVIGLRSRARWRWRCSACWCS